MRFLPQSIREQVFMKFEDFHDKLMALRKWFKEKTKLIGHWEDPVTKTKQTHLLGEDEEGNDEDCQDDDNDDLCSKSSEELRALVRRANGRFGNNPGGRRPPSREVPPVRDARDVRCDNCGVKGYSSPACLEAYRGP